MAQIAAYIEQHYAGRIRMADLARHANVSVRTLQNLFHAHCGEPPLRALRRYRLRRLYAAIQRRPWAPLRVQLDQCGLAGAIADRDLFLEMFGCTIRELQNACRSQSLAQLPAPPAACASLDVVLPRAA